MGEWEEFVKEVEQSECVKLYPGSNVVIGRGSLKPRVVFVGEAPGAEEDRQKQPFVGRSGQLLDEWIDHCGLTKDDYYICNVMKTRPPENRDPTMAEIEKCSPLLEQQIALLKPEIIVCVGRFAMNFFFPEKRSILKESGKMHNGKYYIVPHPSFFLRKGGDGWEPFLDGLKKALSGEMPEQRTLF